MEGLAGSMEWDFLIDGNRTYRYSGYRMLERLILHKSRLEMGSCWQSGGIIADRQEEVLSLFGIHDTRQAYII